jgi:hypothetical protein
MNDRSKPLDWLEPPGNGLPELRARIRRRRRTAVAGASALALAVVIGISALGLHDESAPDAPRQASAPPPKVRIVDGAALDISPPGARGRIYLVATHEPD